MGRREDAATSRETTQGGEELRADCQGARVTLGAQAQQALHPTEAEPARAEEARPGPLRAPEELTLDRSPRTVRVDRYNRVLETHP